MNDPKYLTVQALTKYIKRKFDADPHLSNLFIKGEISNFKRHSSGHCYFTLKDDKARILAVMFQANSSRLKFQPENGMMVLVTADASVYEASGQYQLYVKSMEPEGIGALFLAYEQLKEKLSKEGLFDPAGKKTLPPFPQTIGVVTSPTGAVIRDIITTIERRYPIAKVKLYPASVQGDKAVQSIVQAMDLASKDSSLDLLIIGRGGGSIEELWSFNEEKVARRIAGFGIPVISAVGHETDTTIADFAADRRAPTPTAAAEMAVPHIDEVRERLLTKEIRNTRAMNEFLNVKRHQLSLLSGSMVFKKPERLYQQQMERLDRLSSQLRRELYQATDTRREAWKSLDRRLQRMHPEQLLIRQNERLAHLNRSIQYRMNEVLKQNQSQFNGILSTLEALSPLRIMKRGYSLVYDKENRLIKDDSTVSAGEQIKVALSTKELWCEVNEVKEREK
ncbi:exodeoxyribonuclease VII large subunit [Jeotgalibacillus proteolyticus]|uniref:Exodeoxyribonuclease 7 large subunit n=1 Tax=Jeotgalibacillus proteolyticus TaxID=2082395 RepID=A0A2S5GEJ6_9BACL|nr:exodeoxyribonuclease VII large subunit [Jeotgalibacillus proteolyticus]PPA71368.1 exodeoxyribonuclease VII large subunit [Jeotgalibacillus proteolyticus]